MLYTKATTPAERLADTIISFSRDIQPLFNLRCISCHDGTHLPPHNPVLLPAYSYNALSKGGYLNTSEPGKSKLYQMIISYSHSSRTTEEEKTKILVWIKQGALNN